MANFNIVELTNGKIAKVHWNNKTANFHVYENSEAKTPILFVYHDPCFDTMKVFKLTKKGLISKRKVSKKMTDHYLRILQYFMQVNCIEY